MEVYKEHPKATKNCITLRKTELQDAEGVIIEEPKREDESSIKSLFQITINAAFNEEGVGHLTDFIAEEIEEKMKKVKSFLEGSKEHYLLVAKVEKKVVGIISFGKCSEIIKECCEGTLNDVGELGSLYVLPDYQNQGIGSKLIATLISYLKSNGIKSFCLDSGFKKAQMKWTRKFGEPYKIAKDYWGPGSDNYFWYCQI